VPILVTGAAGFIGSHTLIELSKAELDFIAYDNLSNSSSICLDRVSKIIGRNITFIKGDIRDKIKLKEVFAKYQIDQVIHFAGLKAVGQSVKQPLEYYDNNVLGTLRLLEIMKHFDCKKIVFSSSATVYSKVNSKNYTPFTETSAVGGTTNAYGTSKYMIERILEDLYISDNSFKIAVLRYFNPVGAHESGTIGENPKSIPNNLMPFITQTAVGKREFLSIFGNDYDTHDGTGVRDYVHVVDLAYAHVKAVNYIQNCNKTKPLIVNLGTGIAYSVLDVVKAFEKVSGKQIPYKIVSKRAGDVAKCFANPSYAKTALHWEAKRNLEQMCKDSWNWQKNNPNGYDNA